MNGLIEQYYNNRESTAGDKTQNLLVAYSDSNYNIIRTNKVKDIWGNPAPVSYCWNVSNVYNIQKNSFDYTIPSSTEMHPTLFRCIGY